MQETIPEDSPSLELELALLGLRDVMEGPGEEMDKDESQKALGAAIPVMEKFRDYLEAHHDNHQIQIDIKPAVVLSTRNKLIKHLRQKGTEAPTPIGLGWRKSVYGKAFSDKLMARGLRFGIPELRNPLLT